MKMKTTKIFGLEIVTEKQADFWAVLKNELEKELKKGKKQKTWLLMTPNPEQIVLAEKDAKFKAAIQRADYLIPDGAGLVWATKYFWRTKLRENYCLERITGSDMTRKIVFWAKEKEVKVLVLGGFFEQFVVEEQELKAKKVEVSKIRLESGEKNTSVYWLQGFANIHQPTQKEKVVVRQVVVALKPAIVLVALGAPTQESWLTDNLELLQQNGVILGMAVGGSIDFLTGKVKRAGSFWQKMNLEWFYRLMKEPWRWRRQMALTEFMSLVAKEADAELEIKKDEMKDKFDQVLKKRK